MSELQFLFWAGMIVCVLGTCFAVLVSLRKHNKVEEEAMSQFNTRNGYIAMQLEELQSQLKELNLQLVNLAVENKILKNEVVVLTKEVLALQKRVKNNITDTIGQRDGFVQTS